jgi:HlyD family type I secretion membrane fusion protein
MVAFRLPRLAFATGSDAEAAVPGVDNPRREIMAGVSLFGLFAASTLAWACFVPLDASVVAPGTVKVSGERQKVQSMGDGVISAIRVTEGANVRAGQPLVEFAAPDLVASERSFASRVISLQAEIARLEAENSGASAITPPAAFAGYMGADAELASHALEAERVTLSSRRAAAYAQRSVLNQRIVQVNEQLNGSSVQRSSVEQQRAYLTQEVDSIRQLAAKGYASKNRLLEMERSAAELEGSSGTLASEAARLRSTAGEARMQILQADTDRQQANSNRLRDAHTELQALLPQWEAARAQLARTQLRAPVSGSVVALEVNTIGGVTQRGQTLMEIVPADRSLTIEAQVAAVDGNEVSPGKQTMLKLPGLHGRNIPELHGTVSEVSADSLTVERTGRTYYTMQVKVAPAELERFTKAIHETNVLRPGNPVQVVVKTRSRSALEYWLEPLTQALHGGLNER